MNKWILYGMYNFKGCTECWSLHISEFKNKRVWIKHILGGFKTVESLLASVRQLIKLNVWISLENRIFQIMIYRIKD